MQLSPQAILLGAVQIVGGTMFYFVNVSVESLAESLPLSDYSPMKFSSVIVPVNTH
jgi:hypothetical protein